MLFPSIAVVGAFVAGLFVDERTRQAIIPLSPRVQIVGAAVIMGIAGALFAYFPENERAAPLLIGIAVLWALVVPAVHVGNVVRDKVSPNWRR